jgi:hypothetical protein
MTVQIKKKTMRKSLFILTTILATVTAVNGQTKKQIQFVGYHLVEYKKPVMISEGKYKAYYENMGEAIDQGRIVIDETLKTFTIKWLDGDDWECKFTKKETKNEHDDRFGDVTRTIYTGKWIDDNFDCIMEITTTKSSGCITQLQSKRVVDTDYGIDTWKKTFTFGTGGKCLN